MTPYDAVMVGLVLAGMIWGAIRGMTWQVASIASLVLAYFFAHQVSAYIVPYIPGDPVVKRAGSMLGAYVLMSAGVYFIAWSVRATLKKMKFEAYDRHLGMVLGGLEGSLLGLVGTMFVVSLAPAMREPIFSSATGRVVAHVMDSAGPALPTEVRDVVSPFWAHLKDTDHSPATQVATPNQDSETPADGSSVQDLARRARARIGKAAGAAVESEVEQLGNQDDARDLKRR
jgi:uncharacterized membrane protein required for colicin V production